MAIKLLITDFDGTLADTFEANFRAYRQAFSSVGLQLSKERYRECFGFRFDRLMDAMKIDDDSLRKRIKEAKAECYPDFFDSLSVNRPLLEFIRAFRRAGGKTALASTAREKNLRHALEHIGAIGDFDLILAGENVKEGKPNPEIYQTVLARFGTDPTEALVFEDSEVGFKAAQSAGIQYIDINSDFFGNGN